PALLSSSTARLPPRSPPFPYTPLFRSVDREAIAQHLLFGLAVPLDSPLAPATWGYAPAIRYTYEPLAAKRLLAAAGSEARRPFELWSPSSRYLQDKEVAEAVAAYLEEAGLDVRIR